MNAIYAGISLYRLCKIINSETEVEASQLRGVRGVIQKISSQSGYIRRIFGITKREKEIIECWRNLHNGTDLSNKQNDIFRQLYCKVKIFENMKTICLNQSSNKVFKIQINKINDCRKNGNVISNRYEGYELKFKVDDITIVAYTIKGHDHKNLIDYFAKNFNNSNSLDTNSIDNYLIEQKKKFATYIMELSKKAVLAQQQAYDDFLNRAQAIQKADESKRDESCRDFMKFLQNCDYTQGGPSTNQCKNVELDDFKKYIMSLDRFEIMTHAEQKSYLIPVNKDGIPVGKIRSWTECGSGYWIEGNPELIEIKENEANKIIKLIEDKDTYFDVFFSDFDNMETRDEEIDMHFKLSSFYMKIWNMNNSDDVQTKSSYLLLLLKEFAYILCNKSQ